MINCKQATQLVSNGIDQSLGLPQRMGLKLHLLICRYCRNYARHLHFIHRIAGDLDLHIEHHEHTLPPQSRMKLKQLIDNNRPS